MHARWSRPLVPLVALLSASACTAPSDEGKLGRQASALHSGDTHDVSTSSSLPEIAVGQLRNSDCGGTVIARAGRTGGALVLTAAHCFCNLGGIESPGQDWGSLFPTSRA